MKAHFPFGYFASGYFPRGYFGGGGGYRLYLGPSAVGLFAAANKVAVRSCGTQAASIPVAASAGRQYMGVGVVSALGVETPCYGKVLSLTCDGADVVSALPNGLEHASAKPAAAATADVTIRYSARGQQAAATGVQIAEWVAGAWNWAAPLATITVGEGVTSRTVNVDGGWAHGDAIRLAARAVTADGDAGPVTVMVEAVADATGPADVAWITGEQE